MTDCIVISQELWQQSDVFTDYNLNSIYFMDSRRGFAIGNKNDSSKLFRSDDEGESCNAAK